MEIQKVGKNSVKIKAKNVSFVTNTFASGDSIPIFFTPNNEESSDQFFIEGTGEYEVSGVRIKGLREGEGILYELTDDPITLKLLNSKALKTLKDVDEGTILLVESNSDLTREIIDSHDPYLTILYGEVFPEGTSYPEVEKINLRKLEELKGVVILK